LIKLGLTSNTLLSYPFLDADLTRVLGLSRNEHLEETAEYDRLLQQVQENAKSLGFRVIEGVPKDGNCFYEAVARHLGTTSAAALRRDAIKYLREHPCTVSY